jgi:hypothetical protein
MTPEQRAEENNAAYWRLKPMIDQKYPKGRAVAIDGGRVIADAATFEELEAILKDQGIDSPEVLFAEAGSEYPEITDLADIVGIGLSMSAEEEKPS